jgi:hypothetical protein
MYVNSDELIDYRLASTQNWMWCQRCQRCYQEGEYRLVKGIKLCPYDECIGLIMINSFPWSGIQKMYPHKYPAIPERGVIYDRYD